MEGFLCVRKGAWSKEEDDLLTACVRRYGEGKWHLVPTRAGLNRCRKSCRLRWLNYLKPSINRGKFTEDEVDMMKRLHRLLGNRWSLIAGRLPGRTSDGVKNYWTTHISKKESSHKEEITNTAKPKQIVKPHSVIIKPQPWTFSNTSPWLKMRFLSENQSGAKKCPSQACAASTSEFNDNDSIDKWWGNMMDDKGGNQENNKCCLGVQDGMLMKDFNWDEELTDCLIEDQSSSDFLIDINLWDL